MVKRILFVVLLIAGIAGFFAVPLIVGVPETIEAVGKVGWLGVVAFVVMASLTLVAPAIGWWILLRAADLKVSVGDCIRANFMSFPINFLTPSAYVGGEPVKVLFITRKYDIPGSKVVGTLIVGKFQEVAAMVLLMLLSAAGLVFYTDLISKRDEVAVIIAMAVLIVFFVLFILAYTTNYKPMTRLAWLLTPLRKRSRKLYRLIRRIRDTEQTIHDSSVGRWRSFLISQAITFLSAISVFMRLPVFMHFHEQLPSIFQTKLLPTFAVFIVINLINLFQFIPGSLGFMDGLMVVLFDNVGLQDTQGAAFQIVSRVADAVFLILGIWLLMHYGLSRYMKPKAKAELKARQTEAYTVGEDGVKRPRTVDPT